ncbi:hypothetical protein CXB51_016775 [Gossypium anomalum]|uniref:Prolamin-like domain-containing protein n=1 Tax=Gossypium anomalum TaxID=47600 RepID=A0A8J5Z4R0_9ROSI|nr:hypothetical protein CXB51_016775 [Gossypium anomalum]
MKKTGVAASRQSRGTLHFRSRGTFNNLYSFFFQFSTFFKHFNFLAIYLWIKTKQKSDADIYMYIYSLHEHVDKSLCQRLIFSIKTNIDCESFAIYSHLHNAKISNPFSFHGSNNIENPPHVLATRHLHCCSFIGISSGNPRFWGCLMSFASVKGCVEAIHEVVSHEKFDALQPKCCKAIIKLGDNCWPIVFPNQPCLPVLLKTVCKVLGMVVKVENVAAAP